MYQNAIYQALKAGAEIKWTQFDSASLDSHFIEIEGKKFEIDDNLYSEVDALADYGLIVFGDRCDDRSIWYRSTYVVKLKSDTLDLPFTLTEEQRLQADALYYELYQEKTKLRKEEAGLQSQIYVMFEKRQDTLEKECEAKIGALPYEGMERSVLTAFRSFAMNNRNSGLPDNLFNSVIGVLETFLEPVKE